MRQKGSGEGRTRVGLINKWTDKRRRVKTEGHMAWRCDSVNEGGFKGQQRRRRRRMSKAVFVDTRRHQGGMLRTR